LRAEGEVHGRNAQREVEDSCYHAQNFQYLHGKDRTVSIISNTHQYNTRSLLQTVLIDF
jgi:hypothetical protein